MAPLPSNGPGIGAALPLEDGGNGLESVGVVSLDSKGNMYADSARSPSLETGDGLVGSGPASLLG